MAPRPGLSGSVTATVSDDDTALALGSGDLMVLGTPRAVALCEAATVASIQATLAPGTTSVGTSIQVNHRRPTAVGRTVTATATVVDVDGSRLVFEVALTDDADVTVMAGTIERAVVEIQPFLDRL